MKHYSKLSLICPESLSVPKMEMQIVDVECFHCHQRTRWPVPNSYIDWEPVAEDYRKYLEKVMGEIDQMIADIDVMQSGPNPVREYIANKWKFILGDFKDHFGKDIES